MKELNAYIFGKKIGTLIHHNNQIYFEYDKDFKSLNLEISPIKLNTKHINALYSNQDLPLVYGGLAGVFYDSLPDKHGMAFIDRYFAKKGLQANKITLLHKLAFIGDRGMGAIEYLPQEHDDSEDVKELLSAKNAYEEIKNALDSNNQTSIKSLMNIIDSVSPVGGGRPKMLVQYSKECNGVKFNTKALNTNHKRAIIKFDEIYYNQSINFTKMEFVYMRLAKECDINTPPIYLYKEQDEYHLIIERFDRDANDEKLHLCTASALLHTDISLAQTTTYENLLALTLKICNNQNDVFELYKRMVFNALAFNFDDHAKNFSFLMDKNGNWSISPAYDMTYSKGLAQEHICTINNKGKDFTKDDFLTVAKKFNIKKSDAVETIDKTVAVLQNFAQKAREIEIDNKTIKECEADIMVQISLLL